MWLFGAGGLLIALLIFGGAAAAMHSDIKYPTDNVGLKAIHSDQCEQLHDKTVIAERQNTWSNLAYLVAGIFVLVRARSAVGWLFGGNLVILAFMSGLYHATLDHGLPQVLDVAWVYAVLFSLILKLSATFTQTSDLGRPSWYHWVIVGVLQVVMFLVCAFGFDKPQIVAFVLLSVLSVPLIQGVLFLIKYQTGGPASWYWWAVMTLLLTVFGFLMRKSMGWDSDAVFPILVVDIFVLLMLVIVDAIRRDGNSGVYPWPLVWELGIVAGVAGLGFFFRLNDGYAKDATEKLLCSPGSIFQAHAWWHILSAGALLLTYDVITQLERSDDPWVADLPALLPEP
jgi:hypothetical protein